MHVCTFCYSDFTKFVIKHYGTSLQYGSKYIFQSLPRLLTLWLDFGQTAQQIIDGKRIKVILVKTNLVWR